jgi:hypothetical protein
MKQMSFFLQLKISLKRRDNKWPSYGIKKWLKDPMVIAILPADWEVFLLADLTEYDTEYLKSTLLGIIESMDSEKSCAQLRTFIRK